MGETIRLADFWKNNFGEDMLDKIMNGLTFKERRKIVTAVRGWI